MFRIEFIVFIAAFVVTYLGVGWFRGWSLRKGYLDHPNERSSHETPTPRGGGLVIAAVTLTGYIGSSWLFGYGLSTGFIVGAILIVAVSWLDDIYSLSFVWRFLVHSVAGAVVIADLGYFDSLAIPFIESPLRLGIIGAVLSLGWIVWLVNAYNFMDGIDGIAGIQAVAAGLGWLIAGLLLGIPSTTILGGVILWSSAGFLIHNWQPAKIFMGDAGSAFLGFTFATMPFLLREKAANVEPLLPVVAVLFVWLFVFDAALTLLRRLLRGERIWTAHREHLYQRSVIAGRTHQFVSTMYGLIAFAVSVSALFLLDARFSYAPFIVLPVVSLLTIVPLAVAGRRSR